MQDWFVWLKKSSDHFDIIYYIILEQKSSFNS